MKEKIKNLFVQYNKTPFELAEIFKISQEQVIEILKEFGLKVFSNRKYYILKAKPFTKHQLEFMVGCILGNGKLKKYGKKSSYFLFVEENNKDILLWKKLQIPNFVNVIESRNDKWNFKTIAHNELNTLYNRLFLNNKLYISENIASLLTPLSMTVFFLDKGSLQKNQTIKFQTSNYTKSDHENLQNILKVNFDINSKICTFIRNNIEYHYLLLNKRNSEIFMKLISPFINEILND